jgi:hypothetical protein
VSRMPHRTRHLGRQGPPADRGPRVAIGVDPVGGLRALVEEGIVTAAALNARDDLELAAASTQRLGALTSGMWRALSRELATAAERLDRSTMERMEDIERRARALHVDADDVAAAGVAAIHLAEHRETLETLLQPDEDAHLLAGTSLLFGFSIDALEDHPDSVNDDDDDDDEPGPVSVTVTLFLWPAPLTPATVSIVPSLPGGPDDADEPENMALDLGLAAPEPLLDALCIASGLAADRVSQALSALGVACWTAHHLDEQPTDELDELDEEEIDDDVEADGGPDGG